MLDAGTGEFSGEAGVTANERAHGKLQSVRVPDITGIVSQEQSRPPESSMLEK
jgi:hypothetical protein